MIASGLNALLELQWQQHQRVEHQPQNRDYPKPHQSRDANICGVPPSSGSGSVSEQLIDAIAARGKMQQQLIERDAAIEDLQARLELQLLRTTEQFKQQTMLLREAIDEQQHSIQQLQKESALKDSAIHELQMALRDAHQKVDDANGQTKIAMRKLDLIARACSIERTLQSTAGAATAPPSPLLRRQLDSVGVQLRQLAQHNLSDAVKRPRWAPPRPGGAAPPPALLNGAANGHCAGVPSAFVGTPGDPDVPSPPQHRLSQHAPSQALGAADPFALPLDIGARAESPHSMPQETAAQACKEGCVWVLASTPPPCPFASHPATRCLG